MDGLELELPTLDLDAPFDNEEVVETPEVDNEEVVDEAPAAEDAPPAEEEEEQSADGRKVPDDVRKALKALRDSSPENAKAARIMNDVYGREQAYKAIYPTVKDAVSAQNTIQTLESFGGLDAVQSTIAEIEEVDRLLADGDPKALDKIIEVSGEGFAKIAPHMLDRLQASNPDAYAAAIRPHLVTAIGQSGLTDAFGAVMQALDIARTPGATAEFKAKFEKDATDGLAKIHQYLSNLGKQAPPPAAAAPGADKLTAREQAVAAAEAQQFNNQVGSLANGEMNKGLQKAVAPYLKGRSAEARADYIQGVYDEVTKLVKADKDYQKQKDAMFKSKTKDAGKIADLMTAKFNRVVGQAAKVVNARRPAVAVAAKGAPKPGTTAPGGTGSVEKPIMVKELPSRNDVDWNKTTDDMAIRGIRVLKSGKVVRLDR